MNDGQIPSNPEDVRGELTKDDQIAMLKQLRDAAVRDVQARDQIIFSLEAQIKNLTLNDIDISGRYRAAQALIALLNARLSQAFNRAEMDKNRIDFLEASTKGYGLGWIFRESVTGRGMRLHETSLPEAKPSVREAIDAAMEVQNDV